MAADNQTGKPQPLEQMARLPRHLRLAILAGVFVLALAGYGYFLLLGIREDIAALDRQLAKVQGEIAKNRAVESNLESFERRQVELRGELRQALERLPNQKELPVLLTDLSTLGKKSGLEIHSFRPESETRHGFYAEVPIEVEFVGSYHETAMFFDRLSRLSRIVNITELSMKPSGSGSDPPRLDVKGTATTFRFLDQDAEAGGGA